MGRRGVAVGGVSVRAGAIFPGQGSQVLGMAGDVVKAFPASADLFRRAERVLGYDLFALTQLGPEERLRETQYSQPAIYVANLALHAAVAGDLPVVASSGHSFGEYCSLTIADAMTFEEGVRLVNERGLAMQRAAEIAPGAMAAILGLDEASVAQAVAAAERKTGLRVQLANLNSPGQIVVSGDAAAVRAAGDEALGLRAKRVVPLNVSGAWHSALMEPAVEGFSKMVAAAHIGVPTFTVIGNLYAKPLVDPEEIKARLVDSLTHQVRWHDTALRLLEERLDIVVEFGASPVLSPLFKRMPGAPPVVHVGDLAAVERLRNTLGSLAQA
ncbi:MAG TPA: ACP S-malonyltransferase [Candidatus Dormibacteraeota bacterium]|nr:ACP S-malonyltransferase [Candidatus Dormibacteraeota bacterium]